MPYIRVSTNVSRAAVGHVDTVLKAVSKSLSVTMEIPEAFMMVEVETDRPMLFNATTEPCAFVNVRSKGKIDDEHNPKTIAAITETMWTTLGVPKERVFIYETLVHEVRALFEAPPHDTTPARPDASAAHVLFFDGGSRQNPGPGGSGACVVRVDEYTGHSTIVWSAAVNRDHPATTNNQAEYNGLLAGLRAARRFKWSALEVVGDSALVLMQLRRYRAPRNTRLLELYREARRLADQIDVRRWTHHARAYNTMADSLASLAMDSGTSSEELHPTATSGHADLHQRLINDLRPWLASIVGHHVE